jgi:uncharacterized protein with von Willebrand factor type A (vWA) domain
VPDLTATSTEGGVRLAVAFSRVLRGLGVDVSVGATLTYARALAAVGLDSADHVYWCGRSTLLCRPEDTDAYERAFRAFWLRRLDPDDVVTRRIDVPVVLAIDDDSEDAPLGATEEPDDRDMPAVTLRYSPVEVLRHRDFATYTPAEHAEARRLMSDLRLASALRRSRRLEPHERRRGRPDLRRTVRRSLRSGGEPVRRSFRRPGEQSRRLVLLLDVSGSMEPYARALARFLHAAVVSRTRVEAFALGTRLTRITRELESHDPDEAMRNAARRVVDWSGGTRLGEQIGRFNDEWGVRGMARGAVVVILSDGWDRGDPDALAEQMARLRRVAHRIVWVNPLKASEGYAPLARGMAAALPYVDDFVEGHSVAALESLAEVIAR